MIRLGKQYLKECCPNLQFKLEKVYFTPSTIGGGLLNLLNYETVYSTPELFKTGQITPRRF
jgi:hypothetical protein